MAFAAAVLTSGFSAAAATAGVSIYAGITTSIIGQLLIGTVLGAASRALMPKPSFSQQSNRGYQVNSRGAALDHQIIYGEVLVGGAIIFEESVQGSNVDPTRENPFLLTVYAHAGHEIEGHQEVYIDGKKVTEWRLAVGGTIVAGPASVANGVGLVPYTVCNVNADGSVIPESEDTESCHNWYGLSTNGSISNNMVLRFYDGTQTTADATLIADSDTWDANCVLNEIAYMIAVFGFDRDVYPDGVPEITCTIKGKKCFDPRTGNTVWSDNPALCLRDYLVSSYGITEKTANIDDDLVAAAANVSDQTNTGPAGANRYTCNGAFTTASTPYEMINALLTSMDGSMWYAQGKWRMKPAYWLAPVLDLNEDDLRSSISVSTRHSRRDNFNVVKGTFRGPESNWQTTDYPQVNNKTDAGSFTTGGVYCITFVGTTDFTSIGASSNTVGEVFVATGSGSGTGYADSNLGADGGQESVADVDLPFTDNSLEARRIALISLERNRQQLTVSAAFGLRALEVQVGDNIRMTSERFGWVNKEFEVISWSFGLVNEYDLQTDLVLRETAESVYDEVDDGVVYERENTNLPSAFDVPIPESFGAVATAFVNEDGTTIPKISFSWSVDSSNLIDYYEFQWKLTSDSLYSSANVAESRFTLLPAESNESYDSRVRSINTFGVKSAFTNSVSPVFTVNDTTIPTATLSPVVSGGYAATTVEWVAPTTNTDATAIKDLFQYEVYRDTTDNPTTLVGTVSGTSFTDVGLLDSTTYYYRVKALDFTKNVSAYSPSGNGTTNAAITEGTDGLNNATVFLYNKNSSATPPALFSGTFTYTFSTGILSGGTLNGWTQVPPNLSAGESLFVSLATASSRTATDTIPTSEFSTPEVTGIAGTDGANGSTTARVSLFRKTSTSSAPSDPSGTFTYTFSTGILSGGTLNGWSQSAPSIDNGEYLWVIQASAFSTTSTDSIAASEFTAANIIGIGGTNGVAAKLLTLNATSQVFTYNASNVADPTSQTITFNAFLENTVDTSATFSSSPSVTLSGSGNSRSLSVANFGANNSVTITATADSGAVSDTFTVYRLKEGDAGTQGPEGTSALTLILSNESHTLAADKDGVVSSYASSGTNISVFEGTTALSYAQGSTANSTWSISTTQASITVGSITDNGANATVGNQSNMTADNAIIYYLIQGKRANGASFVITKTQTFSKSRAGDTGGLGARGAGRWNISVGSLPTTSSAADTSFVNALGFNPVDKDQAWFYTGSQSSPTLQNVWIYALSGDVWTEQTEVIDGSLIVSGTITASQIDVGTITADRIKIDNITLSSDANDNLVINGGGVDTSELALSAVTVPVSKTENLGIYGGDPVAVVQTLDITLDVAGEVLIWWSGGQGYTGSASHLSRLFVAGVERVSRGGNDTNDMPSLAWSGTLTAATHTVSITWIGESTNILLNNGTLVALGVKR
jgi:hypothetical protein